MHRFREHSDIQMPWRQDAARPKKGVSLRLKRIVIICLWSVATFIVANGIYNFQMADKHTPIWERLTTNSVFDLWGLRKNARVTAFRLMERGSITGIVYAPDKSCALIGGEVVYEGDVIDGVRVAKICPDKVAFERNGIWWKQRIREKANPLWLVDD